MVYADLHGLGFGEFYDRFVKNRCVSVDVEFVGYRFVGREMHQKAVFEIRCWDLSSPYVPGERRHVRSFALPHRLSGISFHRLWYYKDDHWEETESIRRFMICDHDGAPSVHPMIGRSVRPVEPLRARGRR